MARFVVAACAVWREFGDPPAPFLLYAFHKSQYLTFSFTSIYAIIIRTTETLQPKLAQNCFS